jgi:hypothetical protein
LNDWKILLFEAQATGFWMVTVLGRLVKTLLSNGLVIVNLVANFAFINRCNNFLLS